MRNLQTQAPIFALLDQNRRMRALTAFRGSYIVLYFYPKDDTPGCTTEACMISEVYDDFAALGVTVIGISPDSTDDHLSFAKKYKLPFILLSDPAQTVIAAYEAKGEVYTNRITYLIDPEGVIIKTYDNVDPATHALTILNDFQH